MRRIVLMGRSGSGKTTLSQALTSQEITYKKTQSVIYEDLIIDTPGEYAQTKSLGYALALYSYEADVVGLLIAADEPYSLYPPNITCMANRDVIGIVTKIHSVRSRPRRAEGWLRLSGCETIFFVDSVTGEGVDSVLNYLTGIKTT